MCVLTVRESYALRSPDERKRIQLGHVPAMVDVLRSPASCMTRVGGVNWPTS